ncbi:hypothetical protein L211DRAFT_849653 [Terfezia boudieri ATCC MYA-4762]|uniref:Uncharacterized protein n=1 Tax=Terfezia boudieri ATCC MYA-4762 TaxID=1051890 RepID=A0A3N4LLI4_9PEZI|nr:hypothetical protein L211DRAFT_849653 [Terfezia boudieri ATCC MYA-4762]
MAPKPRVIVPPKKRASRGKKAQGLPEVADTIADTPPAPPPAPTPVRLQQVSMAGVLQTPSKPSQKRKLSTPVPPLSEESDVNEEEEEEGDIEIIHTMTGSIPQKTPTPRDSIKKRLKVAARGDLALEPVIRIKWVPEDMKVEILKANHKGNLDEVFACVRWYMRVILLVRRELTAEDRKKLVMMLFGMNEAQASLVESSQVEKQEHFGVKVGRKIKTYHHGLIDVLRKRFDALLAMFWKSDTKEIQDFIEGQFDIWKVTSQANARRSLAKVDIEEVNRPIIWENEIIEYFLKGKMKLIHDVWSNVLDVLEPEYLLKSELWGGRFMQSTATILCWLITYTFRLDDPV